MPLVAGYTSRLFALVLVIVIAMPATAVGSTTPAPEATVDTTLISFDIAVAIEPDIIAELKVAVTSASFSQEGVPFF